MSAAEASLMVYGPPLENGTFPAPAVAHPELASPLPALFDIAARQTGRFAHAATELFWGSQAGLAVAAMKERGRPVWQGAKSDWAHYENKTDKIKAAASGAGVVAPLVIGAGKLPTIGTGLGAAEALQMTGKPWVASLAAVAIYGSWVFGTTRSINNGVQHYPTAFQGAGESLPSVNKLLSRSLPGLESPAEPEVPRRKVQAIGRSLLKHLRIGMTAQVASSAYPLAAGLKGLPESRRRRVSSTVSLDGALVAGAFYGAAAAEHLDRAVAQPIYIYGAIGALAALESTRDKWRQKPAVMTTDPTV